MPPAAIRVYLMDLLDCLCHFSHCLHHITSNPMTHYLRSCTPAEGHYRSPTGHCFYHKKTERLRPGDRSKKAPGLTEQVSFPNLVYLTYILNQIVIYLGQHLRLEILLVDRVHIAGQDKAHF
jgi:hypothetical protein